MTERALILRGGLVLDTAHVLGPADVSVQRGRIVALGGPGTLTVEGAEEVDASRRLLHPGLINAHTHGHGNLSRSMGDRWTLELLLAASPWITALEGAEQKWLSATIGAAEMVLKGCTVVYDLFVEVPGPTRDGIAAVAEAYHAVGMRAVIAPMVADLTLYQAVPALRAALPEPLQSEAAALRLPPWQEKMNELRAIVRDWRFDQDWLRPAVAPTIPLHCADPFLEACRDLADEFGTGMHSHIAEAKFQVVTAAQRYGRSMVAHGVWLDAGDMAQLGGRGASVAHNPASNMRLGNGVADMAAMLAAGVNVGLGTDAAVCSDNLNMYAAMQFAGAGSHARGPDPAQWVTAAQVLTAATTGSAQALGFADMGRIAPGYVADIVLLDLDAPTLIPLNDPVTQLVFGEDGTGVHSVMIGGKFVVRDRRLLTVDLPRLAAQAAEARAAMNERGSGRRWHFECIAGRRSRISARRSPGRHGRSTGGAAADRARPREARPRRQNFIRFSRKVECA